MQLIEQKLPPYGITPAEPLQIKKLSPITSREHTPRKADLPSIYTPLLGAKCTSKSSRIYFEYIYMKLCREKVWLHSSDISPLNWNEKVETKIKVLKVLLCLWRGGNWKNFWNLKQVVWYLECMNGNIILRCNYFSRCPTFCFLPVVRNVWDRVPSGIN